MDSLTQIVIRLGTLTSVLIPGQSRDIDLLVSKLYVYKESYVSNQSEQRLYTIRNILIGANAPCHEYMRFSTENVTYQSIIRWILGWKKRGERM